MKYILSIYDSLSKKKKHIDLSERKKNPINIYVCGITPYDHAHIGHARCYISYDVLIRLIRFLGYKITYIQNITDVNDKIFNKSLELYNDEEKYLEVANFYHKEFQLLLNQLGCISPDYFPRVSQSINDIINLIEKIINNGNAYETNDGIYFKVNSFDKYGELSNRITLDKENISRIEDLHEKNNNDDFVLWKKINKKPFWPSPWGNGRPGWHIECSAMIKKSFGEQQLDIHGGGMDLLFPHHENEKAQSECCSKNPLTSIWMHIAFINVNKEKMSKSSGNSFYLKDIVNKFDPMVFRLYLLMHHYTCPIEFNINEIDKINETYNNLITIFNENNFNENNFNNKDLNHELLNEIYQLILDNLNTAAVIGLIFKNKNIIKNNPPLNFEIKKIIKYILGLSLEKKINNAISINNQEIEALIKERETARQNKDFKRADEIRKILNEMGISINDSKI